MRLGISGIATTEPLQNANGAYVGRTEVSNAGRAFAGHFTRGPTASKKSAVALKNEGAAGDVVIIDRVDVFSQGTTLCRIGRGLIELANDGGLWESILLNTDSGVGMFQYEDLDSVAGLMDRFIGRNLTAGQQMDIVFPYPMFLAVGEYLTVSNETDNVSLGCTIWGREYIA